MPINSIPTIFFSVSRLGMCISSPEMCISSLWNGNGIMGKEIATGERNVGTMARKRILFRSLDGIIALCYYFFLRILHIVNVSTNSLLPLAILIRRHVATIID